jgi:hypothetical protein
MAVSLAFGVLFSTFVTLVLVPTGYTVLEDTKAWLARVVFGRREEHPESLAGFEQSQVS